MDSGLRVDLGVMHIILGPTYVGPEAKEQVAMAALHMTATFAVVKLQHTQQKASNRVGGQRQLADLNQSLGVLDVHLAVFMCRSILCSQKSDLSLGGMQRQDAAIAALKKSLGVLEAHLTV